MAPSHGPTIVTSLCLCLEMYPLRAVVPQMPWSCLDWQVIKLVFKWLDAWLAGGNTYYIRAWHKWLRSGPGLDHERSCKLYWGICILLWSLGSIWGWKWDVIKGNEEAPSGDSIEGWSVRFGWGPKQSTLQSLCWGPLFPSCRPVIGILVTPWFQDPGSACLREWLSSLIQFIETK